MELPADQLQKIQVSITSAISSARNQLLDELCRQNLFQRIKDQSSRISIALSHELLRRVSKKTSISSINASTSGSLENSTCRFLQSTLAQMECFGSGHWSVYHGEDRLKLHFSNFEQFPSVARLSEKAKHDPDLGALLQGSRVFAPDVVVGRSSIFFPSTCNDGVDPSERHQLLHASISCKWTLRSDRSQNARTEALNLIRNRNGRVPHIVAITAEPTPKRIASIAQGTSDLDCVYHVALPELREAVAESLAGRRSEQGEDLDYLIAAKRLRDISDLPLDLAI